MSAVRARDVHRVPFLLGESCIYPDGLIRVSRGSKSWTALVEVKTGTNELEVQQLENYLGHRRTALGTGP